MKDLGIQQKAQDAILPSGFDALLVTGPDHVQYLTGALLPFLPYRPDLTVAVWWPARGEPTVLSPLAYQATIRQAGRIPRVIGYSADEAYGNLADAVAGLAGPLASQDASIGVDAARTPAALFQALVTRLPDRRLSSADALLERVRMVKTGPEADLLEDIAYRTDHGLNGYFHHIIVQNPPPSLLTAAENTRIHCMERGLQLVGYYTCAQVAAGDQARQFFPRCPSYGHNYGYSATPKLALDQIVRFAVRTTDQGYCGDAGRIFIYGEVLPEQDLVYQHLILLRDAVLSRLVPGACCAGVYHAVVDLAARQGMELISVIGLGHGVGACAVEPPFLTADDETTLEAGMVLVIDLAVRGPAGEIVRNKDTVVVDPGGARIVGWWKDWREPYIPGLAM